MTRVKIPNSLIYVVADVLGSWYYNHTALDTLFGGNGFPGEPPGGNCVQKCQAWLRRANDDATLDPLELLGRVLVEFMHNDRVESPKWQDGHQRIVDTLARNGLRFDLNGIVSTSEVSGATRDNSASLSEVLPRAQEARRVPARTTTKSLSILFMDLSGWSKLTPPQIDSYLTVALPNLNERLKGYEIHYRNTWGDALVATFESAARAAECALDVRDFFRRATESQGVPPSLKPRISLHWGEVTIAHNPILDREDIFGDAVHVAARLEPMSPLGQVLCTKRFADALADVKGKAPIAHPHTTINLPKGYGAIEAFVVTGPGEEWRPAENPP